MNVRTPTIRSLLVLLAALAASITFKHFTQTRKPALVARLSKLPTPITNGLFEFSVTASNAGGSDMYIGNIRLQNNSVADLSPHRIPSTVSMGDADVAPGKTLTRDDWSAFPSGARDRVIIGYVCEPGPLHERLLGWLGRVPILKSVFHLPRFNTASPSGSKRLSTKGTVVSAVLGPLLLLSIQPTWRN